MAIVITDTPFDPWQSILLHQQQMNQAGKYGAVASFVGSMRDFNDDQNVESMTLEHYPGMTEKHLVDSINDASRQWELIDTLIIHRTGRISIGDAIVLVAVWSVHRKDAFEACRFMMEDLKSRAPFWKQELTKSGKRWVEKNTPG